MISSLAIIFLVGLSLASIADRLRLPRIIGMLLTGVLVGPFVLDLLDSSILDISPQLRKIALIIILIKAGLSLKIKDLKRVGRPALLMSFLPAVCEILAVVIFAPLLLGVSVTEAAIIGAVLSAVSPAVVVPRMVQLIDERFGTDKSIPQLILAGASLDDVFVIVLFSVFVGVQQSGSTTIKVFFDIPASIVLGIILGIVFGTAVSFVFEKSHTAGRSIRNSSKVIIVLGFSLAAMALEDMLKGKVSISGYLAVMSLACVAAMKCREEVTDDLSGKFGRLWVGAEVILFVMVGAAVDIRYTFSAGAVSLLLIVAALIFRSAGVLLCLIGTPLNKKEKLFCVFSYLPKATVQAAIGSVPLSMGLACGNTVLSIAVLSIIITAPIGAFLMDTSYKKLLKHEM